MIDFAARRQLATALRKLVAGRITNDEFEDSVPTALRSKDPGVRAVWHWAWTLYDDLHEHRLVGPYALNRRGRTQVARCVLFLRSGRPYEWFEPPRWAYLLLALPNALTFGLAERALRAIEPRGGDRGLWPFVRRPDLEVAASDWLGARRTVRGNGE